MRSSYSLRMFLLVLGLALAAILPCFNLLSAVIPQFFPRLTIFAMQLLGIYKPESKQTEKGEEEP